MSGESPAIGVVVVAYGDEPLLAESLAAVLSSAGVTVDLVAVDNGFTAPERDDLLRDPRITWLRPGRNTGFTGGCNLGAAAAGGDLLVFVNSDAIVAPHALDSLATTLADDSVGLVTGKVVLYDDPTVINSAGNPVHYSLLSWAGAWGESAAAHAQPAHPASISGSFFGVRRAVWDELGGFHEPLFAYGEDVELSLRAMMTGRDIVYDPGAVARHSYAFHRNPGKYYLLERNRLLNLLTLYEPWTLAALAPALLMIEAGITATAIRQGWFGEKAAGWAWILRHRAQVRARRAEVQRRRVVPDRDLLPRLELRIEPSERAQAAVPPLVNRVLAAVGARASRTLGRRASTAGP